MEEFVIMFGLCFGAFLGIGLAGCVVFLVAMFIDWVLG